MQARVSDSGRRAASCGRWSWPTTLTTPPLPYPTTRRSRGTGARDRRTDRPRSGLLRRVGRPRSSYQLRTHLERPSADCLAALYRIHVIDRYSEPYCLAIGRIASGSSRCGRVGRSCVRQEGGGREPPDTKTATSADRDVTVFSICAAHGPAARWRCRRGAVVLPVDLRTPFALRT